jgi:hypothetical protein
MSRATNNRQKWIKKNKPLLWSLAFGLWSLAFLSASKVTIIRMNHNLIPGPKFILSGFSLAVPLVFQSCRVGNVERKRSGLTRIHIDGINQGDIKTEMTSSRQLILIAFLLGFLLVPHPGSVSADSFLSDGCTGVLQSNQVVVYYFHRKFRCQSCEVLESTLQNTMRASYAKHFGAGRLAMCVVNLDEPENRHYLDQFGILSNSVVLVEKRGGTVSRFKNLEAIWEISENRDAIDHMLRTEMARFLPES